MAEPDSRYTSAFFTGNARNSMRSARPILQIIRDLYSPTSIVDIGCGSGAWLATAEQLGFTFLRGYDGPWADPAKYTSPNIDFIPVNIEESDFEHDRRFDLAMSVETAEHLSESRADFIVDSLCSASDVVLFGAAIPHQGGVHHIHEKPQTYWMAKFRERGYEPFDVIRPAVWDNDDVQWWFRQNTLLYVKQGSGALDPAKLHAMESQIWDVVHPVTFTTRGNKLRQDIRELRSERDTAQQALKKARAELRSERDTAQQARGRIAQLERQMSTMRPPRRSVTALRSVKPADIPAPLRPAVTAVWRRMPAALRAYLRPPR